MKTVETIPGTREIAQRLVRGEDKFVEQLVEFSGVTWEDAGRMFAWMRKKKLVVRDFATGLYTVKHGAYLDKDVLLRIRDAAC